jgi:protein-S-isoprenylcysteine O-methyltransferase Ste14
MIDYDHLFMIVVGWILYFLLHSLFASILFKSLVIRHFSHVMPCYRLCFNIIAIILLIVPLWLTFSKPSEYLYQWHGLGQWLSNILVMLAIAGFVWSLRFYDSQEFLGLKQLKENASSIDDQESFKLSPLHRFVRHPWYFLGLVLIWSREMNLYMLTSAIMMTLYFWIGSRLEERKLRVYYGERYQEYAEKVPALFPLPWKYLTADQADRLVNRPVR